MTNEQVRYEEAKAAAIRAMVARENLTWTEVARRMGVSKSAVSRWNSLGWPDSRVSALLKAIGKTPADLGSEMGV